VISRCSWPDRSAPASTMGKVFFTRVAPTFARIRGFVDIFVHCFGWFETCDGIFGSLGIIAIPWHHRRCRFPIAIPMFRHPRLKSRRSFRSNRTLCTRFCGLCFTSCRSHGIPHPRIAGQELERALAGDRFGPIGPSLSAIGFFSSRIARNAPVRYARDFRGIVFRSRPSVRIGGCRPEPTWFLELPIIQVRRARAKGSKRIHRGTL
jgi:hypothetical protein